jgi:hypothetical protein
VQHLAPPRLYLRHVWSREYNDQGFFKDVFGQNSNKVIFFYFFLCGSNQDFKIKPPFIYIYIYILARTKQIKNLGVYADFDKGSIKRTLTYD